MSNGDFFYYVPGSVDPARVSNISDLIRGEQDQYVPIVAVAANPDYSEAARQNAIGGYESKDLRDVLRSNDTYPEYHQKKAQNRAYIVNQRGSEFREPIANAIKKIAPEYVDKIDPDALLALAAYESGLSPKSWSADGGRGLFQKTNKAWGSDKSKGAEYYNPDVAIDQAVTMARDNYDYINNGLSQYGLSLQDVPKSTVSALLAASHNNRNRGMDYAENVAVGAPGVTIDTYQNWITPAHSAGVEGTYNAIKNKVSNPSKRAAPVAVFDPAEYTPPMRVKKVLGGDYQVPLVVQPKYKVEQVKRDLLSKVEGTKQKQLLASRKKKEIEKNLASFDGQDLFGDKYSIVRPDNNKRIRGVAGVTR